MAVFIDGWLRLEGPVLSKTLSTAPNTPVFYGTPEVQMYNQTADPDIALKDGVVYRIYYLNDANSFPNADTWLEPGTDEVNLDLLEQNWSLFQLDVSNLDRTIDSNKIGKDGNEYYKIPIAISRPAVIFYSGSSLRKLADGSITGVTSYDPSMMVLVLVERIETPKIIAISAEYRGPAIPVGEAWSTNDLNVYVIYEDGNRADIRQGYTVDPANRIVNNIGSNVFKVNYTYTINNGSTTNFTAGVVVPGEKKLTGITATYVGANVVPGQQINLSNVRVIATFTDSSSAEIPTRSVTFSNGLVMPDNPLTSPRYNSNNNTVEFEVYYKGFTSDMRVPVFDISTSTLVAYYNGPSVEVGERWQQKYAKISIYHKQQDGTISQADKIKYGTSEWSSLTFSPATIEHVGVNDILVTFTRQDGSSLSTTMIIVGIEPQTILTGIQAEYTGPAVAPGKTYSLERVLVLAVYSKGGTSGDVVQVTNFTVDSNIIPKDTPETAQSVFFTVTYTERNASVTGTRTYTATIEVPVLHLGETTEDGYQAITLNKMYPEASRQNNRYRGPAESRKHMRIYAMIRKNIQRLYSIYEGLENEYNNVIDGMSDGSLAKYASLNTIRHIERVADGWINCPNFATGVYEESENE